MQELEKEFIEVIRDYCEKHILQDSTVLIKAFEKSCVDMITYQQTTKTIPIEHIALQFSETDYYFGKSNIKICFYEAGKPFENPVMVQDAPAKWLTAPLDAFSERISEYRDVHNKTKEWAELTKRKLLRMLLKMSGCYLKYPLRDVLQKGVADSIFHMEELSVSYGQQTEWQIPICRISEPIDPVFAKQDVSRRFRIYEGYVFRKQEMKDLDFTGSIFKGCRFERVKLENCIWNDVVFRNCTFKDAELINGTIYGALFDACQIDNLRSDTVKIRPDDSDMHAGIFRELQFIN